MVCVLTPSYADDQGELQVSKESGCTSGLDECNGKMLQNGQYAYFITPTYPFVPQCLRGSRIGTIEERPLDRMVSVNAMYGFEGAGTRTTTCVNCLLH